MKILFLFPYPLDQAPSQRFRFEQYFDVLLQSKYSINTQSFWGDYYWKVLYGKGNNLQKTYGLLRGFGRRLKILPRIPAYDVIFIHRELAPIGPPVLEWIITKIFRKKVIFDFDDAIWLPNTSENNTAAAWLKWHGKTASICQWAWKVSAGNAFLAAYARRYNHQVIVNPTTIDTAHHTADAAKTSEKRPLVIGWTGSHSTLPYLDFLWPDLEELHAEIPFQFRVIANRPPPVNYSWLSFVPWKKETEIEDLADLDIGVMPLTDDEWSRGKCGFKALQYMALGIPTVASAVGVNTAIIRHGESGLLCSSKQEWISALDTLLRNEKLRKRLGEEGMVTVRKNYSVEVNTSRFLLLFK